MTKSNAKTSGLAIVGDQSKRLNITEVLDTLIPMARNTDDFEHRHVQRCGGTPVETFDDPQEYAIQSVAIEEAARRIGK